MIFVFKDPKGIKEGVEVVFKTQTVRTTLDVR